jgi:hypothetical protein
MKSSGLKKKGRCTGPHWGVSSSLGRCPIIGTEGILVCNVHGLNTNSHRDALRQLVVLERPSVMCLQETKLVVILSSFDVVQLLGQGFNYTDLPATQTHGRILVA